VRYIAQIDLGYVPVACADYIFGRQISAPAALIRSAQGKAAPPVRVPGRCWSSASWTGTEGGGAWFTRLSAGLAQPVRPAAGPRPLFAIGEAAVASRSPAVHATVMVTSACRATVGSRNGGPVRGRPRRRGAASGREPGPDDC